MLPSLELPSERYRRRLVGNDVDEALAFFTGDYDFRAPVVRRTHENAYWDFAGVGDERMSLRSSRFLVDLRSESRVDDQFLVAWLRHGSSRITSGARNTSCRRACPSCCPSPSPTSCTTATSP